MVNFAGKCQLSYLALWYHFYLQSMDRRLSSTGVIFQQWATHWRRSALWRITSLCGYGGMKRNFGRMGMRCCWSPLEVFWINESTALRHATLWVFAGQNLPWPLVTFCLVIFLSWAPKLLYIYNGFPSSQDYTFEELKAGFPTVREILKAVTWQQMLWCLHTSRVWPKVANGWCPTTLWLHQVVQSLEELYSGVDTPEGRRAYAITEIRGDWKWQQDSFLESKGWELVQGRCDIIDVFNYLANCLYINRDLHYISSG